MKTYLKDYINTIKPIISSSFINWPNSYKLQLKYDKPTTLVTNFKAVKQIECTYKVIIKCTLLYRTFSSNEIDNYCESINSMSACGVDAHF